MKSALLKFLIVFFILVLGVVAALYFIGLTEDLSLTVYGKTLTTKVWKVFLAGLASVIAIIAAWSFLRMLWDLPHRLKTGVSKRKRGQALEAMEDALIAASAGDADKARKKAARARTLIDRPALGNMVSAQAAEVSGDPEEAQAQYTKMLDDEKTRRVAQRGLASIAYNKGDLATAMSYAEQAYADNKNAKWAFDILFGAQVADGQWIKASETLASGERRKHVSKEIAKRRDAALLTAEASRLHASGQAASALDKAVDVAKDNPGFAPAVSVAARFLVQNGQDDKAAKLIEKAWSKDPHPALSLAYRDLLDGEAPKARAKRMKSLMRQNSSHRESILLGVEEALRSGDGVAAWGALAPLAKDKDPSARICELAERAESLLKNIPDARLWAARAATAPVEPDWSDLDPDGPAFDYSDADWRRLVYSYGDSGELIHPRHERFEKTRPALDTPKTIVSDDEGELADVTEELAAAAAKLTPPSPDNPGVS